MNFVTRTCPNRCWIALPMIGVGDSFYVWPVVAARNLHETLDEDDAEAVGGLCKEKLWELRNADINTMLVLWRPLLIGGVGGRAFGLMRTPCLVSAETPHGPGDYVN